MYIYMCIYTYIMYDIYIYHKLYIYMCVCVCIMHYTCMYLYIYIYICIPFLFCDI